MGDITYFFVYHAPKPSQEIDLNACRHSPSPKVKQNFLVKL